MWTADKMSLIRKRQVLVEGHQCSMRRFWARGRWSVGLESLKQGTAGLGGFRVFLHLFHRASSTSSLPQPSALCHSQTLASHIPLSLRHVVALLSSLPNPSFLYHSTTLYNVIAGRPSILSVVDDQASLPIHTLPHSLSPPLAAEPVALDCGSFDWHITLIIIAFFARDLHCNVLDTARCHGRPASGSFGSTRDVSPGPRCSTELACRLGRRVAASRQPYVAVASLLLVFSISSMEALALTDTDPVKYFLISAPVDWSPDQYIRRFLLPTGEYVSCVLWYVIVR